MCGMQVIDDSTLGRTIVVKPSSKNTSHRLQVSILALVPTIPRPQGLTINWMTDDPSVGYPLSCFSYIEVVLLTTI